MELFEYIDTLLNTAGDIFREEKEKLLSRNDLLKISYGQFHFIDALAKNNQSTISSLAEEMKLTKPTVTVAIQKMEKNGLVYKRQSETDKRISYIYLTEKGERIKQAEKNALIRMEEIIKSGLSSKEKEQLMNILARIDQAK